MHPGPRFVGRVVRTCAATLAALAAGGGETGRRFQPSRAPWHPLFADGLGDQVGAPSAVANAPEPRRLVATAFGRCSEGPSAQVPRRALVAHSRGLPCGALAQGRG